MHTHILGGHVEGKGLAWGKTSNTTTPTNDVSTVLGAALYDEYPHTGHALIQSADVRHIYPAIVFSHIIVVCTRRFASVRFQFDVTIAIMCFISVQRNH